MMTRKPLFSRRDKVFFCLVPLCTRFPEIRGEVCVIHQHLLAMARANLMSTAAPSMLRARRGSCPYFLSVNIAGLADEVVLLLRERSVEEVRSVEDPIRSGLHSPAHLRRSRSSPSLETTLYVEDVSAAPTTREQPGSFPSVSGSEFLDVGSRHNQVPGHKKNATISPSSSSIASEASTPGLSSLTSDEGFPFTVRSLLAPARSPCAQCRRTTACAHEPTRMFLTALFSRSELALSLLVSMTSPCETSFPALPPSRHPPTPRS